MSRSGSDNSFNSEASLTTPFLPEGQGSSDALRPSNQIALMEEGHAHRYTSPFGPGGSDVDPNGTDSTDAYAGDRTSNAYCDFQCLRLALNTCVTGLAGFWYRIFGKLDIHGRHNIGKLTALTVVTLGGVSGAVAIEIFKAAHTAVDAGNGRRLASGALEAGFTAINGIADIAHPAKFLGGMAKAAHMASPALLQDLLSIPHASNSTRILKLLLNSTNSSNITDTFNSAQTYDNSTEGPSTLVAELLTSIHKVALQQLSNTTETSSGTEGCENPAEHSNTWGTELLAFIDKVVKSDHQEMSAISWIVLGAGIVALLACVYGLYQCFKPKANQETDEVTDEAKEKALAPPSTAQKIAIWTIFNIYVGMTLQLTTTLLVSTYLGEGYYHDWNDMLNDILKYYECLDIPVTSAIYNSSVQTASQYIFHKFIHKVDNYLEDTTGAGVEWGYPLAFLPLATPFIISGMIMGTRWLAMKALTSAEVVRLDHALNKMEVETYYGGFALEERRRLALIGNNLEKYKRIYAEHYETVEKMKGTTDPRVRDQLHKANNGLVNDLLNLLKPEIEALDKEVDALDKSKGYDAPETIAAGKRLKELKDERDRLASRKGPELDQQIDNKTLDRAQARNALEETIQLSPTADIPLIYREIPDDGNCFFAAIAQASGATDDNGQPYTAKTLREAVISHIEALPEDNGLRGIALATQRCNTLEAYRSIMQHDGTIQASDENGEPFLDDQGRPLYIRPTWGAEPELRAACQIVKRNIRVFREDQQLEVYNTDNLADAALAPINLLYTGNHYDRFEPAEDTTEENVEQAILGATQDDKILTYISANMINQKHAISTIGFHSRTEAQQRAYNTATGRRIMTQANIGISVAENFGMIQELARELNVQGVQTPEEVANAINQQRNLFNAIVASLENGTCRPSFLRVDLASLATDTYNIILQLRQLLKARLQQGFINHGEHTGSDDEFGGSHVDTGYESDDDIDGKDGLEFKAQEKPKTPPPPPPKKQEAKEQVTIGKTKHDLPTTLEESIRLIDLATSELYRKTAAPEQTEMANRQSTTLTGAAKGHPVAKQQAHVVFRKLIINLKNNLQQIRENSEDLRIAYGKLLNLAAQATLGTDNQSESQDVKNAKRLIENHLSMARELSEDDRADLRADCQRKAEQTERLNQSDSKPSGNSAALFGSNSAGDNLGAIHEASPDTGRMSPSNIGGR